jgi:hypothetical protein
VLGPFNVSGAEGTCWHHRMLLATNNNPSCNNTVPAPGRFMGPPHGNPDLLTVAVGKLISY